MLDRDPQWQNLSVRLYGHVDETSLYRRALATVLQPAANRVIQEVHQSPKVLLAIVEVAFPAGQEVRYARAEDRPDEQSLERLLAVEYVVQQPADDRVVADVPVVAELRRYVQNVVELAEQADRPVLHHRDVVIAQSREDDPLAHVLLVEVFRWKHRAGVIHGPIGRKMASKKPRNFSVVERGRDGDANYSGIRGDASATRGIFHRYCNGIGETTKTNRKD